MAIFTSDETDFFDDNFKEAKEEVCGAISEYIEHDLEETFNNFVDFRGMDIADEYGLEANQMLDLINHVRIEILNGIDATLLKLKQDPDF